MKIEPNNKALAALLISEAVCFGFMFQNKVFSVEAFAKIFSILSVLIITVLLIATLVFLFPKKYSKITGFPIIRQFIWFILAITTSDTTITPYSQKISSLHASEKDKIIIALLIIFGFCLLNIFSSYYYSSEWDKKEFSTHQTEITSLHEPAAPTQGSINLKNDEIKRKDVSDISNDIEKGDILKKENVSTVTPIQGTDTKIRSTVNSNKNLPIHENWLTLATDPSVTEGTNNDCGSKYNDPCLTNRLIERIELKNRDNMHLFLNDRKLLLVLSFKHSTQNPATGAGTFVGLSIDVTETVNGMNRSCHFVLSSSKNDPTFSKFYKISGLREKLNIALELMTEYLSERISRFVQRGETLCGI